MDQANDFLIADEHTKEDINMMQIGISKVEFIRSKNYLQKLAILISRQEKELFQMKNKTQSRNIYLFLIIFV